MPDWAPTAGDRATLRCVDNTLAQIRRSFGAHPFQASEARGAGITKSALAWAVSQGWVRRLGRGSYQAAGPADYLDSVRAALARHPGAVASHDSAAAIHGLACPWPGGWRQVHLSAEGYGRRFALAQVHRMPVAAEQVVVVDGLPCTIPERTVVDLAAGLPLPAALVVADSYARLGKPSRAQALDPAFRESIVQTLHSAAALLKGRRGIERARRVCSLGHPAAESPAESWARGQVIEAGYAIPRVGVRVTGAEGHAYYADLCWEDLRLIAEIDGAGKYKNRNDLLREKRREDELREAGWRFVRWAAGDLWRDPDLVATSLARQGLTARSGSERNRRDEAVASVNPASDSRTGS